MKTSASLRTLLVASASVTVFALTSPAFAADADTEVGEVLVTAQKKSENINDVPLAVTAVSGEKLDAIRSSGGDIRVFSARVPSLTLESSFGRTFPRFYIRGLGNTDFDPNAAQPVSVVYDDVALESPMLKSFPVFDLADVQVLRGPQGTLFGRNTPAGVVKLTSTKPGDKLSGYVSGSLATYNTANVEAAVGGPLGGGFGFRLSGLVQRRDDWVKNTAAPGLADRKLEGYNDRAARLLLSYEGGDFSALFNIHGRKLDGTPRLFRAGIIQQGSNHFVPNFDKDKIALDGLTSQSLEQWGTNLKLDYHFEGVGTLHSITAFEKAKVESTGDIDGGDTYSFPPLGLNIALFPVNTGGLTRPKEFSQELRFESDDMNGFRWQVGAYYFRQKLRYSEFAYNFSPVPNQDVEHDNVNKNFGLFASAEYKATPELTLRAGVRYSSDRKTDLIYGQATLPAVTLPVTNKAKADNVSWDASATYALSPDVNAYARFATGYLGPAIQDRVNFFSVPTIAGKQTTISGEFGFKGVMGRMLNWSIDAYWNRTKNLQLTAVGGATNSARLLNADKAIGYGVEAELEAKPVQGLALTAGVSYNFTEIRDPNIAVAPCGSGVCTVTDPLNGAGLAIIDGNDLPQAPRWVANWTARYGVPVGDGELFAYTDWAYRSQVNYFLYTAKEFRGRSSLEGGLKVGYATNDGLEIAAFARNITNQIRVVSAIDFNNLTGMLNEPRIIGGSLSFRY